MTPVSLIALLAKLTPLARVLGTVILVITARFNSHLYNWKYCERWDYSVKFAIKGNKCCWKAIRQCILCVTTGYHVYHTLLAFSSFNKAWLCRQTHRDAKCRWTSCVIPDIHKTDHTNRYVGKGTADTWCPDVFGVRVPNNGRVLAAAISHQVVHVALPGHIYEISSKMKKVRRVK